MERYINADDIKNAIEGVTRNYLSTLSTTDTIDSVTAKWLYKRLKTLVDEMPTADVVERKDLDKITEAHEKIGYEKGYRDGYAQANSVEVVLCKDCKFYKRVEGENICTYAIGTEYVSEDDFCSHGERRKR